MPRKTDGIPFELHPSPMKDAEGRPLLYAAPMQGRAITLKALDEECCQQTAMSRNDLVNAFNYFYELAVEYLSEGVRIETPLGSFAPRLQLVGDFTDPARVTANDVVWRGVEFQPARQFLSDVERHSHGFHRAPTCRGSVQAPTDAELLVALQRSMDDSGGYTTVRSFAFFAGLTRHSARKWLESQCEGERPRLERRLMGRTHVYTAISA